MNGYELFAEQFPDALRKIRDDSNLDDTKRNAFFDYLIAIEDQDLDVKKLVNRTYAKYIVVGI